MLAGWTVWGALESRWAESDRQRPARERIFAVNVLTVTPEVVEPVLTSFGEIRSRRTLELRSASGGEIVWLSEAFEEGGTVTAGDVIARIDARTAEADRATAAADLAEAETDLRDARRLLALARDELAAAEDQAVLRERALARQRDLLARGVGTEAAVETAELAAGTQRQAVLSRRQALAQLETRVEQATTALERRAIALAEADRRLADTEIRAAFTGILSDVAVTEGRLVSTNERLADLIDPDALEVVFRLSTAQYARLLDETGRLPPLDVTVVLDVLGVDLTAAGQVTRESGAVADGQTGRQLFARLGAAPGFRPGDFVTVRLTEPAIANAAILPASAVDPAGTVLVLGEEERLETVTVEVLRRQGDDVIVAPRAAAGREVVAERTPLLGAGIRVRPLRPGGAEAPEGPDMVTLDAERRARLVAFVESNTNIPAEAKARLLRQLNEPEVPARTVARIESRMGS